MGKDTHMRWMLLMGWLVWIEVGGASLPAVRQAVISGEGVKATFLGPTRTVMRTKKGHPAQVDVPNRFRFRVIIDKGAAPGIRALRVGSAYRLSEPVSFEISALPEVGEAVTNRVSGGGAEVAALPACLNGRLHGAGADRYRFQAVKGMTLVAFTESRVLPCGGFRPVLTFTDAAGKPCGDVTVYNAEAAPAVVFEVPQDGVYALEVKAVRDRCGDACVYRVKLGELPLVTGFAPSGAQEGERLNVLLRGHNLAQKRVRLFTGGKNGELCLKALTEGALVLPGLRFNLSEEAGVPEQEPNDSPERAQPVEVPCVVNGVLEQAGGRDVFRFNGTAGDVVWVDAHAAALGSPLKPVVTVRNSRGEAVARAAYDTDDTAAAALQGRDPSVPVRLAETGAYEVEVTDAEGRSGEAFVYRLRVGPPRPGFQVWMTPASLNIPADGSALVTVFLQRLHGFEGEVRVALEYPPLSIACEGGVIPAGETSCRMTVSTDGMRFPHTVFDLSLIASAETGEGRRVKRGVVPVRFTKGNGCVEARTFAELSAKANFGLPALRLLLPSGKPVEVSGKDPVRLTVLSAALAAQFGRELVPVVVWPPEGFSVQGVQRTNKQERAFVLLNVDAGVVRAGQKGRLILGCCRQGDTNNALVAVTQSVPFVVR